MNGLAAYCSTFCVCVNALIIDAFLLTGWVFTIKSNDDATQIVGGIVLSVVTAMALLAQITLCFLAFPIARKDVDDDDDDLEPLMVPEKNA